MHFDDTVLGFAVAQEAAQLLDQLAGAAAVGDDVGDRLAQFIQRWRRQRQQVARRFRIRQAGGQRLRQLVYQRGGEHAQRRHAGGMRCLRLRLQLALFGLLTGGETGEGLAEQLCARQQHVGPSDMLARVGDRQCAGHAARHLQRHDHRGADAQGLQRRQVRGGLGGQLGMAGKAHHAAAKQLGIDPAQAGCGYGQRRHLAVGRPAMRFAEVGAVADTLPERGSVGAEGLGYLTKPGLQHAVLLCARRLQ